MQQQTNQNAIGQEIDALQTPLSGRRLFSWIFFIVLTVLLLIIPVAASLMSGWNNADPVATMPAESGITKVALAEPHAPLRKNGSTLMARDSSWNPGTLASSHQPWANDCKVCHSTPFAMVKNEDCTACHKNMADHAAPEIAKFSELHEMRCASCHSDHKGPMGLVAQNRNFTSENCSDCHADIKESYPKTQTQNVSDFAKEHPPFRIQHTSFNESDRFVRTRQVKGIALREPTSLKFPHDVHLAKGGVNSPKGKVNMECKNCHSPTPDGIGFKAVTMKADCQSCHDLKFEPSVSSREVPHGSEQDVLNTLREFYSYVGMHKVPIDKPAPDRGVSLIRPGKEERTPSFVNAPGDVKSRAAAAATELFEKTSCVICHEVTRVPQADASGKKISDMPSWKITPVAKKHAWMPKSRFSHEKHMTAECTDCHGAPSSKDAEDVLMPEIGVCRDCHAGRAPEKNKLASDCGVCHGFHIEKPVPGPALKAAHALPVMK
ncbi:MAG: cytochrome c3 family protein [Burkholderiaceae bacterium]